MKPREHQIEGAKWALATIRQHGLAYLTWQERTGKTLTALETAEQADIKTALIITKKKAIDGWNETLAEWEHTKSFTVINYESVHKLPIKDYDFIILDEAHHAISGIGRPSKTWKAVYPLTKSKPILYLSATPYAEHVGLLYNQFRLSTWSPFRRFKDFFAFYSIYGIPNMIRTPYGLQDQRNTYKTEAVLEVCQHLFNFKTRQDVGIKHEPTVKLIKVPLHEQTIHMMNEWTTLKVLTIGDYLLLNDTDMKGRMVHYQLESGSLKIDETDSIFLPHHEKLDYMLANYDKENTAIMCHFIKERELYETYFPHVYSSDGHAEGVDLSHIDKLVVPSMSFKTSKYTQRIARQANHDRDTPIEVDILVGESPAIGGSVYDTVAIKKENFVKSSYERVIK